METDTETEIETEIEEPVRPDGLPDEFWDADAGSIRLDELVGAYGTLASAAQNAAILPDGGVSAAEKPPASPEDYALELDGSIGGPDAEANRRMHEAGFTNAQAQLVYDMASSLLLPLAGEVAGELERAERESRLADRYGGEDGWRRAKGQMEAWAAANLPAGVAEALTGSVEGAAALERLMDTGEPGLGGHGGDRPAGALTLDGLRRLQGDPRYWRDRDPAVVARVMEGYRRLYPGSDDDDG